MTLSKNRSTSNVAEFLTQLNQVPEVSKLIKVSNIFTNGPIGFGETFLPKTWAACQNDKECAFRNFEHQLILALTFMIVFDAVQTPFAIDHTL